MTPVLARKPIAAATLPKCEVTAKRDVENQELEKEADRAAEQALALPAIPSTAYSKPLVLSRVAPSEDKSHALPPSVTCALAEGGSPLEPKLRGEMEHRFGHDFSKVRIHAGLSASRSADAMDAHAYTVGHDIAFGAGKFAPQAQEGRQLIAHELAHVIQQTNRAHGTSGARLQRKPRSDADAPSPTIDVASVVTHESAVMPESTAIDMPPTPDTAQHPAASSPQGKSRSAAARRTRSATAPQSADPAASTEPRRRPPTVASTSGEGSPSPVKSLKKTANDVAFPPLRSLITNGSAQVESVRSTNPGSAASPDLSPYFRVLTQGARGARQTVETHSRSSFSDVESAARGYGQRLADEIRAADKDVRRLVNKRRQEVDRTVRAHDTEIREAEKTQKDTADTYTRNVKAALTEGFDSYRKALADAFDDWSKTFDHLYESEADYLDKYTAYNERTAGRMAEGYVREYVDSYREQDEERKEVQREAVSQLAGDFAAAIRQGQAQFLPDLKTACSQAGPELATSRDKALQQFDWMLPVVLRGVDTQHEDTIEELSSKAQDWRASLAEAAAKMHARLDTLESAGLERNAALGAKLHADIESGRRIAGREFTNAVSSALKPINQTLDDAVGILTSGSDAIDDTAAARFVGEVVDFSVDAAEATGPVFLAARDASAEKMSTVLPFARRGLGVARQGLESTLHSEGVEDETSLIKSSEKVQADLKVTVTALDATYQSDVEQAEKQLTSLLDGERKQLGEWLGPTVDKIKEAVKSTIVEQNKDRAALWKQMVHDARQAAWRYDHPHLKYVVDAIEVAAGFLAAIAIAAAAIALLVLGLPILIGAEAAAVVLTAVAVLGAFFVGYGGGKSYVERREKGQGVAHSIFGAIADSTGISGAYHAFTDAKMSPFERGMAWGESWITLFGAADAAPGILRALKLRLPPAFTNPFRLTGALSKDAALGEEALSSLADKAPLIPETEKLKVELPSIQPPEAELPAAPNAAPNEPIGGESPTRPPPSEPAAVTTGPPTPAELEPPNRVPPDTEIPKATNDEPAVRSSGGRPAPTEQPLEHSTDPPHSDAQPEKGGEPDPRVPAKPVTTMPELSESSAKVAAPTEPPSPEVPLGGGGAAREETITVYHGTRQKGFEGISEGIDVAHSPGENQDFSQGFYVSEDRAVAEQAAGMRPEAGGTGRRYVLQWDLPKSKFGKIVDIRPGGNERAAWEAFLKEPPSLTKNTALAERPGFRTNEEYLSGLGVEQRGVVFEEFLTANQLSDADSIFGEIGTPTTSGGAAPPGGPSTQITIRSQKVADELNAIIRGPIEPPTGGSGPVRPPTPPESKAGAPSVTGDGQIPTGPAKPTGNVKFEVPSSPQVSNPPRSDPSLERPVSSRPNVSASLEADPRTSPHSEPRLSPEAEGRLTDEQTVQAAHERRLGAEEQVKNLQREVKELEDMNKELGSGRKRDYVHDAAETAQKKYKEALSELRKSQRAEVEAEAAERLDLKPGKDIDPAAAQHDPLLKEQAENEFARRQTRVKENNELIKANDADLADARAKVAARQKEFENTRPGNDLTESGRALKQQRDLARERLDSANRHLESVENRTSAAEAANEKHVQRMQELDRQLHPEKYPEVTGDKGDFAENENHRARAKEGYAFRGSSKDPQKLGAKSKPQGLDGVYEKVNPEEKGAKHIVDEVKYDTSRLREGQETADWVDDRLDTAVGQTHANKMRAEGYEYRVRKWDPKSRTFRDTKLWEWRPTGQKGPGGKILGKPHYFPPSP
jgi:Domain of unknown function (DUF4157)